MPSAKSGKAATLVVPAAPREAIEADLADPGEVESAKADQRAAGKGKYGSAPSKPFKPGESSGGVEEKKKTAWIEVELVDADGAPVAGEPYAILLPDGTTTDAGTLDEEGLVRIEGIDPGTCKISFPRLERDAWEPA